MIAFWSALLNGTLLGALLTGLLWIGLRLLPRKLLNAATRHVIWWVALLAVLVMPVIKIPARPGQPIARGPRVDQRNQTRVEQHVEQRLEQRGEQSGNRPNPGPVEVHDTKNVSGLETTPVFTPQPSPPSQPKISAAPAVTVEVSDVAERWLYALTAVWIAAAAFLILRLLADYAALGRLKSRATSAPEALRLRADRWLATCRTRRRHIRFAVSDELEVPVAAGPHSPSILIPASFLADLKQGVLGDAEFDQIGLHESAHISRFDDYALLIQRTIEAIFAFHPVVRFITRQVDLEREIACDDFVVTATSRPDCYASCLTRIAENFVDLRPSLVAAPVANDLLSLTRRVEMLLDRTRHTGTRILRGRLGSMAVAVAMLALILANTRGVIALATPLIQPLVQPVIRPAAALLRSVPGIALVPQSGVPSNAGSTPNELQGRVVEDSSGSPLASVEIRFHRSGMRELAADLETDPNGTFRTADLPPGDYTVDVSKSNFITAAFPIRIPGRALNVRLIRYGIIDGQAIGDAGHPLEGRLIAPGGQTSGSARVVVLAKTPGSGELRTMRQTQIEGGRYRLSDLPPGEYAVGLWYSGLTEGAGVQLYPDNAHPRIFTIAGGEEYRDINFMVTPQPSFSVSGKIALPKPRDQFALALGLPDQPALPVAQTRTAADGSYRFDRVPMGTYDLFGAGPTSGYGAYDSVISQEGPLFGRARVQVSGHVQNQDVPVAPGRSLNVQLRAADSDRPPVGCPESARVMLASLEPWGIMFEVGATANFGAPHPITKLAPGRFRLELTGLGGSCYQVSTPVVDLNGSVADPATIEVAVAGGIRGNLSLSANAQAADFVVVLVDAAGRADAQSRIAFADTAGKFQFDTVPPGRYRIVAQHAGQSVQGTARAAGPMGRWVGDLSRMTEIVVPGGKPISITLIATAPGVQP